jgi:hypothetical protein
MPDAQRPADLPSQPDPNRAGTGATMPRISKLLALVHKLIAYGEKLVTTFQLHPSGPCFTHHAAGFGTLDLAVIIARITCGLRRAAALEARLHRRAATGRDLVRDLRDLPPLPSDALREPRALRPLVPAPNSLPTAEQIAAEVRRKPIGAVIEDICHDLGILSGRIEYALYIAILEAIAVHGGNYARYFRGMADRLDQFDDLLFGGTAWRDLPFLPQPKLPPPSIPLGTPMGVPPVSTPPHIPPGTPPALPTALPTGPP